MTDFSLEGLLTIKLATREECLGHFDPDRIHSYCSSCPNYGARWSCPPFTAFPLDLLGNWLHAVVVGRKVPLLAAEIPSSPEDAKAWAMERFHTSRAGFREILLEVEKMFPGSKCLVAGHCVQCVTCARETGHPCRFPEAMRFSLESVGFDVTSLAMSVLGLSIQWPRDGLPQHFLTVGALLCGEGEAESVLRVLHAAFSP